MKCTDNYNVTGHQLIVLQQGRKVDMVTITEPLGELLEPEDPAAREKRPPRKRVVMVMARQQPGESPTSLIVQADLATLLLFSRAVSEPSRSFIGPLC